ncbi:putative C2H2 finger domain protein [Aspergillus clavatus NRRL 1]|uniref:C2H2 finger domain protein, putative n=1 Tax=Aspergillus clavatus (strain ATCC 1007 / CBS 513.65 / DSM 816 / NCTC 3887 / NRRL 1 / QM 1276 / 107) TaxID=344612 RepID=A1CI80_ASPCL|nr:C2H2 finger domain protein, putative [Aspergillus clavatus NRRL 1]EAW10585.1 C2H2 finger domain protein, putative [Aspergillus clavatus NRRL 1]
MSVTMRGATRLSPILARHRRIHTGKRPYICQEPACERSFCRKTTLTKHQHRSHPPGTMTRPPSEDAVSEQSYQTPVTAPVSSDQYLLTQQPYYHQPSTPSQDFYPQQTIPMTHIPVHDTPPIVAHTIPVTSALDLQHAQQQYMQQFMQQQQQQQHQQRFDPTRQGYIPPEYQQQTFVPQPIVEGHPMMASYNPNFQYKQPTRILNQPEGTDWRFLGVG